MKKTWLVMACLWCAGAALAQQDSNNAHTDTLSSIQTDTMPKTEPDTIRVGNFVIVRQNKNGEEKEDKGRSFTIVIRSGKHSHDTITESRHSAFSTNWFIFDLGFANYNDKTNYAAASGSPYLHVGGNEMPFAKSDLKLLTKSSNVNIWLFMQKLNISKSALNLKYGLGLEMFNFRYDNNISYHKTPSYIFRDSVNFSKDKLYTSYATVPMMLNINPWPEKEAHQLERWRQCRLSCWQPYQAEK